MNVTPVLILRAKSELALRAAHPFARSYPSALPQLCATLASAQEHVDNTKEPETGWTLNDPTCAAYALLHMQSWHITNLQEETPDLLKLTPAQLKDWLADRQNRLSAWTSKSHVFETDKSWTQTNKFLDVWYEQLVYHKIPHGRGCEVWLKRNNVISNETTTHVDMVFCRTIITQN